jgi:hypothetical protein
MAERKRVALIAHDNRKHDLLAWARYKRDTLAGHPLFATGTTGGLLDAELGLDVTRFLSGPTIAAHDIAARIAGREGKADALAARCIIDMGDRAAYLAVDPVRPPRDKIPTVSEGRRWLLAKRLFERAYLWHAQRGRRIPTALGW